MATKYFCDGCGREKSPADVKSFSYLCHINSVLDGDLRVHVDSEMNPVSGRSVSVDLCPSCYNRIVVPAVKALRELQSESTDRRQTLD